MFKPQSMERALSPHREQRSTGKRDWRPFEEAREYVCALGLKTNYEYAKWSKTDARPADIPSAPYRTYPEEWRGWGDWLGYGRAKYQPPPGGWRPFEEAREYVRSLGLKSTTAACWVADPSDIMG
jgi:hypothetical protein